MLNIFPIAESSLIEQTIGYQRPSAHPPRDQAHVPPNLVQRHPGFRPFRCVPRWFDAAAASPYEKLLFPQEGYLQIRNAIIEMYAQAEGSVSLGMCRALGPFAFVLRVFDFLEDSQLINFEAALEADILQLREAAAAPAAYDAPAHETGTDGDGSDFSSPLLVRRPGDRGAGRHEHNFKGKVTRLYVSREQLENARCACGARATHFTTDLIFLCAACYAAQRFPPQLTARNFHEITPRLLDNLWTKRDDYLLLKSIERHGDDWKQVAQVLGKSTTQCIFHFLKMSLLDECACFPAICFGTVPNQITTLIAYISYMVHPAISAELAKAAIKYIDEPKVMDVLIGLAARKAQSIVLLERAKLARLQRVGTEALVRKIALKMEAYRDMCAEMRTVKIELEMEREKLVGELLKNKF